MRRFLLIAICSLLLAPCGEAQSSSAGPTNANWAWNATNWTLYLTRRGTTGGGTFPDIRGYNSAGGQIFIWQPLMSGTPPQTRNITFSSTGSAVVVLSNVMGPGYTIPVAHVSITTNGIFFVTPDPLQTNSFNWTFGPEWGGTILQVRATNGTTLGTWGLPATIGPGGYVLSSSIVTNQSLLTGAQVFLDGQSAASLAAASTNSDLNGFADRPGYALSFGPDYQGGEWQVRRSDGSVAATGSAATFGTVSSGRVTLLPEGSTGSIWTRVPAGDGMGSVWVNSGITVSGNNVTTYNFSSAPSPTPAPTPNLPTNAPAPPITNAPAPVPTPGTNSVGPAPVSTNDVTVDVDTLTEIETDDGEQGVLDQVTSMSEKFRLVMDNFKGAFENVAFTFNEFRKFTLGGVGTNCTLNIGPVSLNLGGIVPDAVRSGMKLFILLVGVFAAIRYTWETFA